VEEFRDSVWELSRKRERE